MEMDELKNMWDQGTNLPKQKNNLSEMLSTDKHNPLLMLEKKTWIAFWIFPLVGLLFAGTFFEHALARHSLVMWLLFATLFAEFIFTVFNLITFRQMQNAQGSIRENLLNRINILSQRFQVFLQIYIAMYLLMAVLLEIALNHHLDSLFDSWGHVSWVIRVFTYSVVITIIYLAKRSSQKKHYGVYLQQIRNIADQMQ